jgi:hypothetical protein
VSPVPRSTTKSASTAKTDLARVTVLDTSRGAAELLERRVGGILQGVARVSSCRPEDLRAGAADVVVCYAHAVHLPSIRDRSPGARFVEVELSLLPQGVRKLQEVNRPADVVVVAEHQRCANYFLSEILRAGITEPRFYTTTIARMNRVQADVFVVGEEMLELVPSGFVGRLLPVPRSVSPYSASQLIKVVFEHRSVGA